MMTLPMRPEHDRYCPVLILGVDRDCLCSYLIAARQETTERIVSGITAITIPDFSNYGPVSAAAWMRLEATKVARGERT